MKMKRMIWTAVAACVVSGSAYVRTFAADEVSFARQELEYHLKLVTKDASCRFVFAKPEGAPEAKPFESRYLVKGDTVWFWGDDSDPVGGFNWGDNRGTDDTRHHGTLFAVYLFLEKELGIHWLWPGEDGIVCRKVDRLQLPPEAGGSFTTALVKSRIRNYPKSRTMKWEDVTACLPEFPAELRGKPKPDATACEERRLWLRRMRLQDKDYFVYGHAYTDWKERFGKTHPEYLNFHDGERGYHGKEKPSFIQLCVSNEAVVDQVVADWCAAGTNRYLNVCANDGNFYCQCAGCKALDVPDPSDATAYEVHVTDRYVNFWNRIAAKARRIRPDVMVVSYLYSEYRLPPRRERIAYPENMLCGSVPWPTEDSAALFRAWTKVGLRNFFLRPNHHHWLGWVPRGYEKHLYDEFQACRAVGMIGVDYDAADVRAPMAIEFYVTAKMVSDPTLSFEEIVSEYYSGYGAASDEVREYFEAVRAEGDRARASFEAAGEHLDHSQLAHAGRPWQIWGRTEADLREKKAILDRAWSKHRDGLDPAARKRLANLILQNEHAIATFRFLDAQDVGRPQAEKDRLAKELIDFRIRHRRELPDDYEVMMTYWWGEMMTWRDYAKGKRRPEVTWSVMHPTELDPAYMARVAEKAAEYGGIDSFEVCGTCHSGMGGMDGLLLFEPYRHTFAKRDKAAVERQRAALRGVVRAAHRAGKRLYYWHREGYLPDGILDDLPLLRDADGEIDLMSEAFYSYLRWRIAAAFEAVPEVDGYVLTLTEADFSVIHNSNAAKYPPARVVERIARVFAEEHEKRGKRFTIRSFGSVAQDYEDIIAGAAAAAKDHRFDIETKATPYDFSPFLSDNPFLRKAAGTTLGIECDGLGEFLGAGYPPCAQVGPIMRYVAAGRRADADRFVIRIDRIGNSIFDSAQEINLYAYMRLIRGEEDLSRGQLVADWAAKRWAGCEGEMSALVDKSFEMVTAMEFVDGNVTFHQHPVAPSFKFLKAGGVFSAFRDGTDLHMARRLWGMQAGKRTPGRKRILAEKDRAVSLAQEGLSVVEGLAGRLSPDEFRRQRRAWSCACKATVATRAFFRCAAAYFDDMEAERRDPVTLKACQAEAERCISSMMNNPGAGVEGLNVRHSEAVGEDLDLAYFIPLRWLCREFLNEYVAERRVRAELEARDEVVDFVVPGGIYDDNRVDRPMHGSYPELVDGKPVRWAGNSIFPNGTVIVEFDVREGDALEVALSSGGSDAIRLSENGGPARSLKATDGVVRCALESRGKTRLEIAKDGKEHPGVVSISLVRARE